MTMTRETPNEGLKPDFIMVSQAEARLKDIKELTASGYPDDAQLERAQLYLDVLYSIANARAISDKRELKKLAAIALEAFQVRIQT